ncbi:SixA phosphatase family protein [Geomesophilobacter sediminis]|uniref:Histidine phosphatase family protein n=1 Tax=Geomesophilobacter sediminis TaxID=2798584 RepID=A0A8J7LYF2_9BACT|nr:histidine phosphatase family protein [Geomesophilobacter sediminis]MBJ6724966.1 histidine phosphatase family protein [Geomesophilobacter sediminis]
MILHILRHAEAVERTPTIEEEHRYLTGPGRVRFRKACGRIRKLGVKPDLIVTSPLVRAVQTADILAERLKYEGEILLDAQLASGFDPEGIDALLKRYGKAAELVIVGHEPDFGRLTAALLGIASPCSLKKGGMVSLKLDKKGKSAEFLFLTTGSGKAFTARGEAIERLQQG